MIYFTQDSAAERICAAYRDLPALALTVPQAARLWTAAPGEVELRLRQLVAEGLLTVTADHRFVVRPPSPRAVGSPAGVAA